MTRRRRPVAWSSARTASWLATWLLATLVLASASPAARAGASTQPIMPLAAGAGDSLGEAHLRTQIGAADVEVAMTAPAVELPPGGEFRLVTCLQTHVLGSAPAAACSRHDVDTRGETGATAAAASEATRRRAVPAPGMRGWATGVVEVLRRTGTGAWQRVASSWIPGGLATAALPLGDAGLPQALGPQGVAVDAIADGGMNTGGRDSICAAVTGAAGQPLPEGVTTGALGAPGPAYSETGAPLTGGGEERGVVLLLHGGGWTLSGSWAAAGMRADADRWRARGWRTVNASYRACGEAIDDAVAVIDHIRARIPAERPLCIVGTSAGAHLALLAAARRPVDVDCVVSQSGPTDLPALAAEQAHDPFTGGRWTTGPSATHNLAVAAFGAENLAAMSPAHQPVTARVLVALGEQDWLLAPSQATSFPSAQRALDPAARVEQLILPAGPVAWGHGAVSHAAIDAFHLAEAELAEAAVADRRAAATTSPAVLPPAVPAPTAPAAALPFALPPATGAAAAALPPARPRRRAAAPSSSLTVSTSRHARSRRLAAGARLRLRVRAPRAGVLRVSIRMAGRTVASAGRAIRAGRGTTLALRLDGRARAQLRRARRPPALRVTASLHDRGGTALDTSSRTITLAR